MANQVLIDGDVDAIQLRVQGHSTQTNPLQTWEDSAGTVLAQVTEDGRFEAGDMSLMTTNESLIEAHEQGTSASVIQRGVNTLGKFTGAISNAITWVMSELQLLGGGTISGIHTALRAKLLHDNDSNDSSAADLRAGDFEAVNQSGSSGTPVGDMTGVQGRVDNQTGAYLTNARGVAAQIANGSGSEIEKAAAFEVLPPVNDGQIDTLIGLEIADIDDFSSNTDNYAIRTGAGKVQFGSLGAGLVKSNANGLLANVAAETDPDVEMVGASDTEDGATGLVPQPMAGDEEKYLRGDGLWAVPPGTGGGGGGTEDYIHLRDEKSMGTDGGTFTSGAWRRRDLNTEVSDTGNHASLSGNVITLAAGTYRCRITCPAYDVAGHQARLWNATGSAQLLLGSSEFTWSDEVNTRSEIVGRFTLSVQSNLEVQHQCEDTNSGDGFGGYAGVATEVYTVAEFWKEN